MRVLHLPINTASQLAITVRALRRIGVAAQGICTLASALQDGDGVRVFDRPSARRETLAFLASRGYLVAAVSAAIVRSEVVHWHYATPALPCGFDLALAAQRGRVRIVEFWGSDIRDPAIESAGNPAYAAVRDSQEYRAFEHGAASRQRQRRFSGAIALVSPGMLPHVLPGTFRHVIPMPQRVDLRRLPLPSLPSPHPEGPLIVHAPTAPILKGTAAVLAAIDQLRTHHRFRFRLVEHLPHAEALALLASCDLYVDQLRIGHHGIAALEAMALGKPVVCFIRDDARSVYPPELPIVSADPHNLPNVLAGLIADPARCRDLGLRGRAYVERHHDADRVAQRLRSVYADALAEGGW